MGGIWDRLERKGFIEISTNYGVRYLVNRCERAGSEGNEDRSRYHDAHCESMAMGTENFGCVAVK